jgi:hypothetical protein
MFFRLHIPPDQHKAYKIAMSSASGAVGRARRPQAPMPDNYDPRKKLNPLTWRDTYKIRPKELVRNTRKQIMKARIENSSARKIIQKKIEYKENSKGQIDFFL